MKATSPVYEQAGRRPARRSKLGEAALRGICARPSKSLYHHMGRLWYYANPESNSVLHLEPLAVCSPTIGQQSVSAAGDLHSINAAQLQSFHFRRKDGRRVKRHADNIYISGIFFSPLVACKMTASCKTWQAIRVKGCYDWALHLPYGLTAWSLVGYRWQARWLCNNVLMYIS